MNKYYYLKKDSQYGPVSIDELKTQITRETLVWCEGMPEWVAAKDVAEIAAVLPPPAPNATPPPPPSYGITNGKNKKGNTKRWILIGCSLLIIFALWKIVPFIVYSLEASTSNNTEVEELEEDFETQQKVEEFKNNWTSLMEEKFVEGEYRGFGGIRNLKITVQNHSQIFVHEYYLRVKYIQSNGKLFKTEDLYVYDLSPGEKKMIDAPDSKRGTDVDLEEVGVFVKTIGHLSN